MSERKPDKGKRIVSYVECTWVSECVWESARARSCQPVVQCAAHIVLYVSSLECVIYTRQTTIKYLIKRNYLNFINETKHRRNEDERMHRERMAGCRWTVPTVRALRQISLDGTVCSLCAQDIAGFAWIEREQMLWCAVTAEASTARDTLVVTLGKYSSVQWLSMRRLIFWFHLFSHTLTPRHVCDAHTMESLIAISSLFFGACSLSFGRSITIVN